MTFVLDDRNAAEDLVDFRKKIIYSNSESVYDSTSHCFYISHACPLKLMFNLAGGVAAFDFLSKLQFCFSESIDNIKKVYIIIYCAL